MGDKPVEASAPEPVPGAKILGWLAFIVAVAGLVGSLVFYQLTGGRTVAVFVYGPAPVVAATFVSLAFAALGLLLVHRRPRNLVSWILLLIGVLIARWRGI